MSSIVNPVNSCEDKYDDIIESSDQLGAEDSRDILDTETEADLTTLPVKVGMTPVESELDGPNTVMLPVKISSRTLVAGVSNGDREVSKREVMVALDESDVILDDSNVAVFSP